jgi:hypothetical protein
MLYNALVVVDVATAGDADVVDAIDATLVAADADANDVDVFVFVVVVVVVLVADVVVVAADVANVVAANDANVVSCVESRCRCFVCINLMPCMNV